VDGRNVFTNDELIRDISGRQPGTVARLELLRDGRRQTSQVKLTERPGVDDPRGAPGARPARPPPGGDPLLGLIVRDLDPGFARRMEIPIAIQGVVVMRVD